MTRIPQKKSGGSKGGVIAAIALLLAGVAVGATYYVKPELFGVEPDPVAAGAEEEGAQAAAKGDKAVSKKKKKRGSAFDGMKLVSDSSWKDATAKRDELAGKITDTMGGSTTALAESFINKEENRMLLAQWIIAQAEVQNLADAAKRKEDKAKNLAKLREDLEKAKAAIPEGVTPSKRTAWNISQLEKRIKRAEAESEMALTMAEALENKKCATLMEMIAKDAEWLQQFAFSGECNRPGTAVYILAEIADKHADCFSDRMVRDIATATALEYARSGWNPDDAVERAGFYIKSYKAGRLNSVFDEIPFWQRRMVCGCKGDNDYGSIESLEWSLENVHLPVDEYIGCCWRCAYRLNNIYGDSIHGPEYYAPWSATYGPNRTALTYLVGGVCGSLSHFGAFSALANGIPAMTAGEPAHCAYVVRVGNKWVPGYSVSWERGLHWQVFSNVYTYTSLHAATDMYADDSPTGKTSLSNALRVAGNIYSQQGNADKARDCFAGAVKAQPNNFMAWREWTNSLKTHCADDAKAWEELNDLLCEVLVPVYPEVASEVLHKGALEGMAKAMAGDKKKLRKCCLDFWRACKDMGPERWRIENLADAQFKQLGVSAATPEELCNTYSDLLGAVSSSAQYMSVILGWGNKVSEKMKDADRTKFNIAMVKGIQKGKGMKEEERDKMLGAALLTAERNRDLDTFQAIGRMLPEKYRKPETPLPAHEPFPGKLASQGGLVWASSTSGHDKPCYHWGLLEPCGGTFHTGKDENGYLVVQLPRQVNVTGVVVIAPDGNRDRLHNMKVQVSEDGEKWTDVYQFGPCNQRVLRADLGDKLPLAKYVRILHPGGPEYFHLNAVFVYGNQAA